MSGLEGEGLYKTRRIVSSTHAYARTRVFPLPPLPAYWACPGKPRNDHALTEESTDVP